MTRHPGENYEQARGKRPLRYRVKRGHARERERADLVFLGRDILEAQLLQVMAFALAHLCRARASLVVEMAMVTRIMGSRSSWALPPQRARPFRVGGSRSWPGPDRSAPTCPPRLLGFRQALLGLALHSPLRRGNWARKRRWTGQSSGTRQV